MPTDRTRSRTRAWIRGAFVSAALVVLAGLLAGLLDMLPDGLFAERPPQTVAGDSRVLVAVLGDSDSQGYQDSVWYRPGSESRGGPFHAVSLGWAETLAMLRPGEVDLGERAVHGGRRTVVRVLDMLGFARRSPRKFDHRYNFAFAAAQCSDLNEGVWRQVPRLLADMAYQRDRWERGIVVIRIGIVSVGGLLPRMAAQPEDAELLRSIDASSGHVARAVRAIRSDHPKTGIVLVGIQNGTDFPPLIEQWQDPVQLANIRRCLDRYDDALRQLARDDPRIRFFDDRAFFARTLGGRDAQGKPGYRDLVIGSRIRVKHAVGDAPTHTLMQDQHYGTAYNAVWTQALSRTLAELAGVTPITDAEVEAHLLRLYDGW